MLHHVDVHVRDLGEATALFDSMAEIVGYRRLPIDPTEPDCVSYQTTQGGRPQIGFNLDPDHRAGSMRLAFSVLTRERVDAAAAAVRLSGARAMEGPALHPEYGDYYAVFFEDVDGNRFEIVARQAES